jgi:hypothetical protein
LPRRRLPLRLCYSELAGEPDHESDAMTEAEWLTMTEPHLYLMYPGNLTSPRKRRLFACACCRRIWHLLTDPCYQDAVEVAERFADGLATKDHLAKARAAARSLEYSLTPAGQAASAAFYVTELETPVNMLAPAVEVATAVRRAVPDSEEAEKLLQCAVLRDIFGNPFRPAVIDLSWLTWNGGTVRQLAEVVCEEGRFADLPILADALEEAGCTEQDILDHCRQPGEHVRGCWVVDLLLGKE